MMENNRQLYSCRGLKRTDDNTDMMDNDTEKGRIFMSSVLTLSHMAT